MINILISGDLTANARLSDITIISNALKKIEPVVRGCDYAILNLETPISNRKDAKPIHKQGPALIGNDSIPTIIREAGFTDVTMANNHIMDYGDAILKDTLNELEKQNVCYFGAGSNIREASQIHYKKAEGHTIAFINCCEHEFSVATDTHGGANPLNPISQFYQIQEARQKADYVIMIIHGGVEHFQYPTARMVDTYRFFVDAGADAVINHHQHCPCGFEIYNGKPIYYGLGNFCFDWDGKRNSIWNLGYLVKLNLGDDHKITSEIIPYRQCDETPMVNLLGGKELDDFNSMMKGLCEAIQKPDILEAKLKDFNVKNDYLYRKMLEPYSGRVANGMYRRGWLPSTIRRERVLALVDFLICESHHERVKELLERLYKQYFNE